MTTLSVIIIIVFCIGYVCIAAEHATKVNKAAVALLMCVACWTLYMTDAAQYVAAHIGEAVAGSSAITAYVSEAIKEHLGDTSETLFFLMGAMTIVEIIDYNGGFNFVRRMLQTASKRKLLWRVAFMTFILSAILDNLTTSIVMVMVLRKLVQERKTMLVFCGAIIISANSGGAFSPIGDVTTIMLWIKGMITTQGVITEIFLPSLVSMVIPVLILQATLKGQLAVVASDGTERKAQFSERQSRAIFFLGVGGLIFVPIFRALTSLPPFMGILLVLGLLWTVTEIFHHRAGNSETMSVRVTDLLSRIDMATILFFLGILMAVACLSEIGALTELGRALDDVSGGNHYLVTGAIGVLSSIVDNVPLVAGCMGMYPVAEFGDMAVDGVFWQLLAYCAGVGGSILIIGSAAGVIVMGLEKVTFGWYLKHISWVAFIGYIAGIVTYYLGEQVIALFTGSPA